MPQPPGSHVIGYARVSTEEQAASGLGLEAQTAAIADATTRRGWSVEYLIDAAASGKHVNPELRRGLGLLATGQADALVVAKMDRLPRQRDSGVSEGAGLEPGRTRPWYRPRHAAGPSDGADARGVRGVRAGADRRPD